MICSGSLTQTITSAPGRCTSCWATAKDWPERNPRPTDAPSYRDPGISHRYEWARILRSRRNIQRDAKSANHPIIISGLSVCQTEDDDDEENAQKRPRNVRVFPLFLYTQIDIAMFLYRWKCPLSNWRKSRKHPNKCVKSEREICALRSPDKEWRSINTKVKTIQNGPSGRCSFINIDIA